jgi:hypothetical protein
MGVYYLMRGTTDPAPDGPLSILRNLAARHPIDGQENAMNPYAPPAAPPPAPAPFAGTLAPVPGLDGRVLVRPRTMTRNPAFMVDGVVQGAVHGMVEVTDAAGRVYKLRFRGFSLDPCPRVEIDGVVVDVFPRLPGWASALCTVPLLLMVLGGMVGAVMGVAAVYGNFRIARLRVPAVLRVVLGALLTAGACALTVAIGVGMRLLRR